MHKKLFLLVALVPSFLAVNVKGMDENSTTLDQNTEIYTEETHSGTVNYEAIKEPVCSTALSDRESGGHNSPRRNRSLSGGHNSPRRTRSLSTGESEMHKAVLAYKRAKTENARAAAKFDTQRTALYRAKTEEAQYKNASAQKKRDLSDEMNNLLEAQGIWVNEQTGACIYMPYRGYKNVIPVAETGDQSVKRAEIQLPKVVAIHGATYLEIEIEKEHYAVDMNDCGVIKGKIKEVDGKVFLEGVNVLTILKPIVEKGGTYKNNNKRAAEILNRAKEIDRVLWNKSDSLFLGSGCVSSSTGVVNKQISYRQARQSVFTMSNIATTVGVAATAAVLWIYKDRIMEQVGYSPIAG